MARAIRLAGETADRDTARRFDLLRASRAFATVTAPWRDLARAIRYAERCLAVRSAGDAECSLGQAQALRLRGRVDEGLSGLDASGATGRSVLRSELEAARQGR